MSYLTYLASDYPFETKYRPESVEIVIDTAKGTIFDGEQDDDFALLPCMDFEDIFTEKKYAVALEWNYYTEGRAQQVIRRILENLQYTDTVELWRIWMGIDEKPIIRSRTFSVDALTPPILEELENMDLFRLNENLPELPVQVRMVIQK